MIFSSSTALSEAAEKRIQKNKNSFRNRETTLTPADDAPAERLLQGRGEREKGQARRGREQGEGMDRESKGEE